MPHCRRGPRWAAHKHGVTVLHEEGPSLASQPGAKFQTKLKTRKSDMVISHIAVGPPSHPPPPCHTRNLKQHLSTNIYTWSWTNYQPALPFQGWFRASLQRLNSTAQRFNSSPGPLHGSPNLCLIYSSIHIAAGVIASKQTSDQVTPLSNPPVAFHYA